MQRSIAFLPFIVCLLSAAAAPGAPQPESRPLPDRKVNEKADPCVRLRAGASLDRGVLGCLEPGTRLRLLGGISGWSHVRLADGTEGWVDSTFLETAPAGGSTPTTATPPSADPATELQRQIAALEGQLQAAATRREATEERLRRTVRAAETAQSEVSRLRQQVQLLEAGSDRGQQAADLGAQLDTARARVTEFEAELTAAQDRLARAASLNAEQERRIDALEGSVAAAGSREADRQKSQAEAAERLRAAERKNAAQAERIRQLEDDPPAARDRETELSQALAAIEERSAEQAARIEQLNAQLADAERRVAEAELKTRLAGRAEPGTPPTPEPGDEPPPPGRVSVRAPIVAAPEPPKVAVRVPAAAAERQADPEPEPLSPTEAAIDTVRAWAAAWSDQRVDDYLSYYAPDFRPPDGLGRDAWEERRRERLGRPAYIRVTITSLGAEAAGDGTVRATFGQEYKSDTFADQVTKVLTLAKRDGRWRILVEQATP